MSDQDRLGRYEAMLRGLERRHSLRRLSGRSGIDFASNDYIGLATSPRLKAAVAAALEAGVPVGATGSRLLRGNDPAHAALEAEAARFFGSEAALFFSGGYMANLAVIGTLPQKGDLLLMDDLIHASAHEGARAGRAEPVLFAHNDAGAAEDAIRAFRAAGGTGKVWIAAESLYSMDGDRAPLADLLALADRQDGFLLVDEAHATGVYGPDGRGLAAGFEGRENVVVLHTCGKAMGGSGALVTLPKVLADIIVNRCRPFIFATAPSPLMAVAAQAALTIMTDEPERRERLAALVAHAGRRLRETCSLAPSGSQILPVIVGDNGRAMALAGLLQHAGYDVRGVRPPTVPPGTARLRISLTLNADQPAVDGLFDLLGAALREQAA
ncbi:8-amino-7-oxononanoate synthase [Xanthobacter pseudotagetidis]|uniref:8-amino-7-oxononanoate synthase n=1 Tax=Xanthobacter pseudotagetidis TaxID=3119911 RepID=UPI003729F278